MLGNDRAKNSGTHPSFEEIFLSSLSVEDLNGVTGLIQSALSIYHYEIKAVGSLS
jgi:hypothetical protein